MLEDREYADLEARLAAHHEAARANRLCEANLFWAYGDLAVSDRDLPALDAWVEEDRQYKLDPAYAAASARDRS